MRPGGTGARARDPYAPVTAAQARRRGWTLYRHLEEVPGQQFDLVFASHVLEHAPDLRGMLRQLVDHLAPGGTLVVMMPFADSPVARTYREAWIGLDPGRHVHVLTRRTFVGLAQDLGLRVTRAEDQTLGLNLAVSEAWQAGTSFAELAADPGLAAAIARYEPHAAALRGAGEGDAWAFALRAAA